MILIREYEWSKVSAWDKSEIPDRIGTETLRTLWWCWADCDNIMCNLEWFTQSWVLTESGYGPVSQTSGYASLCISMFKVTKVNNMN